MPLLGRLKSSSSSGASNQRPSKNKSPPLPLPAAQGRQTQAQALAEPQVCDSPLFGLRREIPLWSGLQQQQQAQHLGELNSVPQEISKQQIHYAFSMMDTNKDGLIDLHDLSQMLANLGLPIDKAILSHIMSSVSKRGDHRISEDEFLAWISNFIQVKESLLLSKEYPPTANLRRPPERHSQRHSSTGLNSRSFTSSSSSLIAQVDAMDAPLIAGRRGSGSGLVLMRSLSSSSVASRSADSEPAAPYCSSREREEKSLRSVTQVGNNSQANLVDLEARNDLKAAFCVFDLDGDGFITLDEIRAGLRLLGETSWSALELSHLFSRCKSGTNPQDLSRRQQQQQQQQQQQRISIDDFVQLLL